MTSDNAKVYDELRQLLAEQRAAAEGERSALGGWHLSLETEATRDSQAALAEAHAQLEQLSAQTDAAIAERVGEAVGGPSIMLPHNNSKPSQCKQSQVHCSVVRMLVPLYKPWNSLLLQQLHRDTATGKAPRQEPAFPEFPTPECIEVQEERPPVNLSLCTPV